MVTQLYDEALRPVGVRATQFTLLWALRSAGPARQGLLGESLGIDSTTLTRSLALLRRRGWTEAAPGSDRRERLWSLTAAGRRMLGKGMPAWNTAQTRLRNAVGEKAWRGFNGALDVVVGAAEQR
ncbi:MAG: MarR family transcriptional regulator [Gemmataceae bacterium]|nr:MarR family transcriptional regulator [Gemmataceae bacterium]